MRRPCNFDSSAGILDLRSCSLMGDSKASRISCNVKGSSALTLVSLSESTPCSRVKSLFEENVEFSCSGGDVLVVGALLPRLGSRGLKRPSPAVDAQASPAKRAATTSPIFKPSAVSDKLFSPAAAGRGHFSTAPAPALTPAFAVAADGKKKAEKPVTPIVHKVLSSGLAYDLLKLGNGNMTAQGKPVRIRYEGRLAQTGQIFDSGDIKFRLGMGEYIRAWDEGIEGMLTGEKRRLYVPARLGYGAEGRPPAIPALAGLIFEVEVLEC